MLRWLWNTLLVVLLTGAGVAVGAVIGRLTCTGQADGDYVESSDGLLPGLDLWEIDCLQYHVLPGAAVGLVVGLVLGLAVALRNLEE
jgi:hypothetical protein